MPEMTTAQISVLLLAAKYTCEELTRTGTPVAYLRCLFLQDEARCLCLFEAASAKIVQQVNELAAVPFTRIVAIEELALDLADPTQTAGA